MSASAADALLVITSDSNPKDSIEFSTEWRTIAEMRGRASKKVETTAERIYLSDTVNRKLAEWMHPGPAGPDRAADDPGQTR
jgi:hypothetical protein